MDTLTSINIRTTLLFCTMMVSPGLLIAQNFVYTNNNNYFAPNTISAYLVKASGKVVQLPHSPFLTGGEGNGANGYIQANRIAVCRKFLFAANDYSGDISEFLIDQQTGNLHAVPGSPFPVGGQSNFGIAIAVTAGCKFVFAANLDQSEIFAFRIGKHGKLIPVKGSPFYDSYGPSAMKVSANLRFLAAPLIAVQGVEIFGIAADGALTTVAGSPFYANSVPGAVDINCRTSLLYVPEIYDKLDVFDIASNGTLSLIPGSPFSSPSANIVSVLTSNGKLLLTSDGSSGVSSFDVGSSGDLTIVTGSPFSAGLTQSDGLSTSADGALVYVSDALSNRFSVMEIRNDGSLRLVAGSPVSTGQDGGLFSLVAYPPQKCVASTTE